MYALAGLRRQPNAHSEVAFVKLCRASMRSHDCHVGVFDTPEGFSSRECEEQGKERVGVEKTETAFFIWPWVLVIPLSPVL